jgi:hypothetical protein
MTETSPFSCWSLWGLEIPFRRCLGVGDGAVRFEGLAHLLFNKDFGIFRHCGGGGWMRRGPFGSQGGCE